MADVVETAAASSQNKGDVPAEAETKLVQGKRHMLVQDFVSAVTSLEEACKMFAEHYGETANECGEPYLCYGKALLELARMETGVLGNALQGVASDDEASDENDSKDSGEEQVENPDKVTGEEREEISVKVDDAMIENAMELDAKMKAKEVNGTGEAVEKKLAEVVTEVAEKDPVVADDKKAEAAMEVETKDIDKVEKKVEEKSEDSNVAKTEEKKPVAEVKKSEDTKTEGVEENKEKDVEMAEDKVEKPESEAKTSEKSDEKAETIKKADEKAETTVKSDEKTENEVPKVETEASKSEKDVPKEEISEKQVPKDKNKAEKTEVVETEAKKTEVETKDKSEDITDKPSESDEKKSESKTDEKKSENDATKTDVASVSTDVAKEDAEEKMETEENGETVEGDDDEEDEDDSEDIGVKSQDEDEGGPSGSKDEEKEDEVSNLQLAWEVLELAKVIFARQSEGDNSGKTQQLKSAEVLLKLGEVSIESENYSQAIEDLNSCLKLQKVHLTTDDRAVAETFYQLGLAYSFDNQFDAAIEHFTKSIQVIQERIANCKLTVEQGTKKDVTDMEDAVKVAQKEVEELEGLLPDIKSKIEDTEDMMKNAKEALREAALQRLQEGSSSGDFGESSAPGSAQSSPSKPTSVISSHLVKRKRKPEEEAVADSAEVELKKPKSNDDAEPKMNGDSKKVTNGDSKPMETDKVLDVQPIAAVESSA